MIPSTLLIVLFVQWTSSWIDFTFKNITSYDDGDGDDDDDNNDNDDDDDDGDGDGDGGSEEYLAIHKTLEEVNCLLASTKRTVAGVPDHNHIIIIFCHRLVSSSSAIMMDHMDHESASLKTG